jgi:hypothetical protein
MGYANFTPYQQLNINSMLSASTVNVQNVASNAVVDGQFSIPDFNQPLTYAYLDIVIGSAHNTDAGNPNYLVTNGNFQLYETATFNAYNAGAFRDLSCYTGASNYSNHWVLPGTVNLASTVPSAYWLTKPWRIYFSGIQANLDFLELQGIYGILRLYFGV